MPTIRGESQETLISLEAAATSARGGFACQFSTSEEYETALISVRRAQGHYGNQRRYRPTVLFTGCALMVVGTVLLLT